MVGRWNIQEVPIGFNLFDTPNMGAARVLQDILGEYMVFIDNHPKKGLYRAVVVSPEEREKIKDGSMKGDYKYQTKNINGLKSAKIAALELYNQIVALSEALVKDEMTPRERLLRQRFNMGNKITKDVIFEVHEIGNEIIIMVKGKKIPSHKFMKFSQLLAGQPYFIADNPFKDDTYNIIDSPYLNMVRDFFIVRSYYFQDSGKFRGPTYTLEEIKIWFDNFDDAGWMDKMTVSKEVKQTLINRSNTMDPLNLTNEFIPFTYVNTHYRDRGNRGNPSNIVIVKGGSNGIIKLNATTTRGNNKLKELNVRFAPNFFDKSKEQSIREIVNAHIKKYQHQKDYKTRNLRHLASEIIASIMTWIYLPLKTERLSVNAWDGNVWSNDPCWIYDEDSLEDTILEPLKPAWDRYYP